MLHDHRISAHGGNADVRIEEVMRRVCELIGFIHF